MLDSTSILSNKFVWLSVLFWKSRWFLSITNGVLMIALNRSSFQDQLKPEYVSMWQQQVEHAAKTVCDFSVCECHPILPYSKIVACLNSSTERTDPDCFPSIVVHALDSSIGHRDATTLENFSVLIGKILWPLGNLIPGPNYKLRVDVGGGSDWEEKGALSLAFGYALKLSSLLVELECSPSYDHWRRVIDFVAPVSKDNISSQVEIVHWSDAWATHSEYRIFTRLNKAEVELARAVGCSLGYGAWVLPSHSLLNAVAGKLDVWQAEIDRAVRSAVPDILGAMRADMKSDFSHFWLSRHKF